MIPYMPYARYFPACKPRLARPVLLFPLAVLATMAAGPAHAEAYNVYVQPLPEWADYASDVMRESTRSWEDARPGLGFILVDDPLDADFSVQWVKEFGVEHVGYAYGHRFIEVGLGDSNCHDSWQPFSTGYIGRIMRHEIGHILGLDHTDDIDNIMYPIAQSKEYGTVTREVTLTNNYAYFMSACTTRDVTTFEYRVSTDDPEHGFDVYFTPSIDSLDEWGRGEQFAHYSGKSCYGRDLLEHSGTCEGVAGGSGVLVILGDKVTNPLTQVTIELLESPGKVPAGSAGAPDVEVPPEPALPGRRDGEAGVPMAPFVDPGQDPQTYIDRYKNEPAYRYWFDHNYPEYSTIYEAVGLDEPPPVPAMFVDPGMDPQTYIDRYKNEPAYRYWFDHNYPEYSTIYEAVGLDAPDAPAGASSPSITDAGCGAGTHLEGGECVATARPVPGGCLVATAAYGSELAPQVQALREIRDDTLLHTQSGILFMAGFNAMYYSFSPAVADLERESPAFRDAVRLFITPMLKSLSIMELAGAEESQVIALGMLVITLNLGLYVALPAAACIITAGRLGIRAGRNTVF